MIAAIVAVDEENGIGKNGDLLFHIPEDMKHFRDLTLLSTVMMGRKTWDSLPNKPLSNRENVVISNTCHGTNFIIMDEAVQIIETAKSHEHIFIIGGGQIYSELLKYCDTLYITKIHSVFEADAFFPRIDKSEWKRTKVSETKNYKGIEYEFEVYKRVKE